jgi:hypothetical protein
MSVALALASATALSACASGVESGRSDAAPVAVPATAPVAKVTTKPAAGKVATTPAQQELEKAVRDAGLDQTVRSFMNEETVGLLFGMMRAVLNGNDADVSPALEQKMNVLAQELPKKIVPLMTKAMDVAEEEMKRAMREQANAAGNAKVVPQPEDKAKKP